MKKSIEKRTYDRIKTSKFAVEYKIKGRDTVYNVELINLGAGGMCFLRNSILTRDDQLLVRFPFKTRKVILNGHIVRIDGREVAVRFANTEEEIKTFVDTFNEEYPLLARNSEKKGRMLRMPGESYHDSDEDDMKNIFDID
ncbi:MAG TPA: PilZ domain-containing protein [Spirochaetota bacterium]|nr:MAG: PilZ domain protein [Spirochaetes bacterium ADurb.BinA120]HPI15356.1 PilZ domain-containing protein [Spirochaetota bacterium]HPO46819.1 PilZ domain-containing protein [Spirochaetota bacterium]